MKFEDYLDTPHDSPIWFTDGVLNWNFKPHVNMLNDQSDKIEELSKTLKNLDNLTRLTELEKKIEFS